MKGPGVPHAFLCLCIWTGVTAWRPAVVSRLSHAPAAADNRIIRTRTQWRDHRDPFDVLPLSDSIIPESVAARQLDAKRRSSQRFASVVMDSRFRRGAHAVTRDIIKASAGRRARSTEDNETPEASGVSDYVWIAVAGVSLLCLIVIMIFVCLCCPCSALRRNKNGQWVADNTSAFYMAKGAGYDNLAYTGNDVTGAEAAPSELPSVLTINDNSSGNKLVTEPVACPVTPQDNEPATMVHLS